MLIRLGGFFFLITLIFWLWAIFDCITAEDKRIRVLPKWLWVVLIVLFLELGALAWVVFGRPRATQQGPGSAGSRHPSLGKRSAGGPPVGPDDDPDFLSGLSKH
ncbi:MAG: PLD nuclease N-terminal domain-containing protein [Actinomycetota bacterium]|nr:PLD nuclease N-terminal domain-containing protein [Actinomycetota bacterium]MDQ2957377.1 PLD nuclease N-terminal domain-containing protein [Actinomycetota bacterium]